MNQDEQPCPAVALGFTARCQGPDRCARVLWGQGCPKKAQAGVNKTEREEH
jgi:hypothetical protein